MSLTNQEINREFDVWFDREWAGVALDMGMPEGAVAALRQGMKQAYLRGYRRGQRDGLFETSDGKRRA